MAAKAVINTFRYLHTNIKQNLGTIVLLFDWSIDFEHI